MRTLSLFEKYETNIDDVGGKRRNCWNILQWSKNDLKLRITPMETTGRECLTHNNVSCLELQNEILGQLFRILFRN